MNSEGLIVESYDASASAGLFQFYVRKGAEKAALASLRELLESGSEVSLADHSRGDCEGADCFEIKNGRLEVIRGGNGYSSGPSSTGWERVEELFEELLPFNYGVDFHNRGYLRLNGKEG